MIVVKKGEQHKPFVFEECKVLMVEPRGVVNTGDSSGNLTSENDIWIKNINMSKYSEKKEDKKWICTMCEKEKSSTDKKYFYLYESFVCLSCYED